MRRRTRLWIAVPLALAAAIALAIAAGWFWLRTSLPPLDGEIRLPGLRERAEVIYDANGIPHIRAATVDDAWFLLGFVHARDRMFQMDFMRRLGSGTLSEVVGERTLRIDRTARTLGTERNAERILSRLPEDAVGVLNAYSAGINAWMATRSGALPPEFILLGYEPKPWQPKDSLARSGVKLANLAWEWENEALRGALAARLSPEQFSDLFPVEVDRALSGAGPSWTMTGGWKPLSRIMSGGPRSEPPASNAWAVAGGRTASGLPLLASDPHLGLTAPGFWYLARVEAPGLNLAGATVPGGPVFVLGHNGAIAWGITNTGSDFQDFFVERISEGDPDRYDAPGGPRPFDERTETIAVKGRAPVELTVRETRHGPVVSDLAPDFAAPEGRYSGNGDYVVAFSSTLLRDDDTTFLAFLRLNRARNWAGFESALESFHSPHVSVTYADIDGNIGFLSPGRIPIRSGGDGWIPSVGWTGAQDWTGFVPYDELPRAFNPPSGLIVHANQRIVSSDYPWFLARRWSPPYRAERIHAHVEQVAPRTVATETALQHDDFSGAAAALVPLFLTLAEPARLDDNGKRALSLMRGWDRRMARGSAAPLIFAAWFREVNRGLYADELGDLFPPFFGLRPRTVARMLTSRRAWCDDATTTEIEDCGETVTAALSRALDELARGHGGKVEDWRWGEAHQAVFGHILLGRLPVLNRLADIRIKTGGGGFTVNRGRHSVADANEPFAANHGAAYRAVYDLSDLSNSVFSVGTGDSGNFLSWRYDNTTRQWRDGEYMRIPQTRAEALRGAAGVLLLLPGPRIPPATRPGRPEREMTERIGNGVKQGTMSAFAGQLFAGPSR